MLISSPNIYRPAGFVLPSGKLQRDVTRPAAARQSGFEAAFDRFTVVYAAARVSPTSVDLVCPPLRNFEALLRIECNGDKVPLRVSHLDRVDRVTFECPADISEFTIIVGGHCSKIVVPTTNLRDHLAGQRVLQTLSKDNPLAWLEDWASYYVKTHGTTALLVYDNGSRTYSVEELAHQLEQISGLSRVLVVDWPYPYGPGGGPVGVWDSDFCQHGSLEFSRTFLARGSRSLINADVDEYVDTWLGLGVHTLAEVSPLGGISYPGVWVERARWHDVRPLPDDICVKAEMPRVTDEGLVRRKSRERRAPEKWTVVPKRVSKRAQLRTHRLRRWWLPRLPGLRFAHFKALSTDWRSRSAGWASSQSRFSVDDCLKTSSLVNRIQRRFEGGR